MPINTDAKVSDVGTTAINPIINASPSIGSIPNIKGSKSDRPAIPPKPGKTRPLAPSLRLEQDNQEQVDAKFAPKLLQEQAMHQRIYPLGARKP